MTVTPPDVSLNILLADDDLDDRSFFIKALNEIPIPTELSVVHDGEQLMQYLENNSDSPPDILFLDLSMPRKTGFECLCEIRENERWKDIKVIIFSTSFTHDTNFQQKMMETLYDIGAQEFIRKPDNFMKLKEIIQTTLEKAIEKKDFGRKQANSAGSISLKR